MEELIKFLSHPAFQGVGVFVTLAIPLTAAIVGLISKRRKARPGIISDPTPEIDITDEPERANSFWGAVGALYLFWLFGIFLLFVFFVILPAASYAIYFLFKALGLIDLSSSAWTEIIQRNRSGASGEAGAVLVVISLFVFLLAWLISTLVSLVLSVVIGYRHGFFRGLFLSGTIFVAPVCFLYPFILLMGIFLDSITGTIIVGALLIVLLDSALTYIVTNSLFKICGLRNFAFYLSKRFR